MVKKFSKRIFPILLALVMVLSLMPMQVFAGSTVSVSDGKISITDTASSTTASGNTVTVTAKGGLLSQTINTITITNAGDTAATVSFDYSASNYSSFSESSATGSKSVDLAAGGTVTMSITGKKAWSSNTATLTLSNFVYKAASATANATVYFDSNGGSVVAEGTSVANGGSVAVEDSELSVVATAASGYSFYAWVNADTREILSSSATYGMTVANDIALEAVFSNSSTSKPYFYANNKDYLFDDFSKACAFAASSTNKTIVLMASATLPAGNYTIPAGVTLLIPFDSAHTLYTTEPEHDEGTTNITPTPYRTLKMASGANITVNGAISLSAKHREAQGSGYGCENSGAYGCINMATGSNITVNNGASLYAWGYIIGDGSVVANSGATIYEYFQFRDFRGGSISTDMEKEYGVFLFSQYYVQNIEVPLTLYAGAIEKTVTSLTIASQDFTEDITFIGSSDAMFTIAEGYVTKRYDGSTDRLIIEANGTFSVSPITIKIGNWATDLAGQTVNINTADYELPITSNLTVIANSGTVTMNQDIALLPGSEIIIREDATCTLGSGVNIYAYDADEWGTYIYGKIGSVSGVHKFLPLNYAPSRTYTRTEADLVDAKIQVDGIVDASAGYVYTTAGGANIFSTGNGKVITVPGTQTVTYQFIQGANYTAESNIAIPITSAKAKNADGSYTETSTATGETTYIYNSEHGRWDNNNHTITDTVTAPTCTENGCTTYTCTCGYSYVVDGDSATGHSYNAVVTEPTCETAGYTTYTCANCSHSYVADETEATGHTWDDGKITTEPTYSQEGSKTHTCSVCGEAETVAIEIIAMPDIDGDGDFDALDLVKLRRIMLKVDELPDNVYTTVVDLNDDGKLNILDLIRIKKLSLEK